MGRGTNAFLGGTVVAWFLAFVGALAGLAIGGIWGWVVASSVIVDYQVTETLSRIVIFTLGLVFGSLIISTVLGFIGLILGGVIGVILGLVKN